MLEFTVTVPVAPSPSGVGIRSPSPPPAPTPRPVVFAFTPRADVDLYQWANYLFVTCATGYFLADLSRVAYPTAMLNDQRGSNVSNAIFLFFALLYVLDCTLYFLVYNQWEREALEEAREKHQHGSEPEEQLPQEEEEDGQTEEHDILGNGHTSSAGDGTGDGIHRRKPTGSDPRSPQQGDFAHRLMSDGRVLGRKARWCFFSHEGGLVNVLEITAALIFATGATMTFFAGIANVDRIIQRRWDSATMTGDTIASAIFLSDSIFFHHIYTRTLQTKAQLSGQLTTPVSCIQPSDPYFWTSLLNVCGSVIYFGAALWGILRQNSISSFDNIEPGSYNKNMLPMLQQLHALYVAGDVFYVASGCILVYAYRQDLRSQRLGSAGGEDIDDPDGSGADGSSGGVFSGNGQLGIGTTK